MFHKIQEKISRIVLFNITYSLIKYNVKLTSTTLVLDDCSILETANKDNDMCSFLI